MGIRFDYYALREGVDISLDKIVRYTIVSGLWQHGTQ